MNIMSDIFGIDIILPFQGVGWLRLGLSQGVALSYDIVPLRGMKLKGIKYILLKLTHAPKEQNIKARGNAPG